MPNSWINFFWVATQMKFKGRGVSPYKNMRREGTAVFSCHDKKKRKFLLSFSRGHGTSFSLNFIWVATQKSSSLSWEKLKFSFWQMNWTLFALAVNQRELNFNWTSLTLYSSAPIILCMKQKEKHYKNSYFATQHLWSHVLLEYIAKQLRIYIGAVKRRHKIQSLEM